MKVLGTFLICTFRKVPKNGKMKVLGTFLMGTLEKYLKIKNESFRYFSNRYVRKVPKNGKIKFLGTLPMGTLYLKIKNRKFLVLFHWVRW